MRSGRLTIRFRSESGANGKAMDLPGNILQIGPRYGPLEVLQGIWWIGVAAFAVSLISTPIVRLIAYRARIVDRPDDLLKPHARPVAYLGGIAMVLGLMTGLGCYLSIMPNLAGHFSALLLDLPAGRFAEVLRNPILNLISIAISSVLITIVGLMDDIYEISPRKKVIGQVAAAGILLAGGVGHKMAVVFFSPLGIQLPIWVLIPISGVMCIVLVVATSNATNLLDGLDGLCGGVTGIIALGFLALSVWLAMWGWPGHEDIDHLRVGLCLAMAGAVLGFLPYNIPPASIFMGDAGSMLLGFFVAMTMTLFCQEGNARWFIASWAVFALPTLDTALAVVRRILSRKSIFAGDRSHLYDQLVDRGMTVKQVVLLFYLLAFVAATLGVVVAIVLRLRYSLGFYAGLLVVTALVFYKLKMITPEPRNPELSEDIAKGEEGT